MKVLYVGGGFVGTCSAAVAADSGHEVLVYDIDETKINKLSVDNRDSIESVLHEEGLAEILIRNRSRISFTSDIKKAQNFILEVDVIFLCLPTPEKPNGTGESDLSYIESAVEAFGPDLAKRNNGSQTHRIVVVNKSTVPVRMIDYTEELFIKHGVKNIGIVSNPEFLVEGKAIAGSLHPDRVVVGAKSSEDFEIMKKLYRRYVESAVIKYIEVNPYEAACAKLVANFLLFNRVVTTYDVVGRACEYLPNLRYEEVRKILVSDPRIGNWGLYDSLYAGGSCFIKDANSLAYQLENAGARAPIINTILESNNFQIGHFFGRAENDLGYNWVDKVVTVFGVAFKQNTNDIRNSGGIEIIKQLLGSGVMKVRVFDPAAIEECKKYFKNNPHANRIEYFNDEVSALNSSDASIICTDWLQFRFLGDLFMSNISNRPYLIMDGRRSLKSQYDELVNKGFDIIAVGSPLLKGIK